MLILANCWKNSKIAQQISVLGPNQLGEPRWILLILTTRSQARFDAPCFASLFISMSGHARALSRAGRDHAFVRIVSSCKVACPDSQSAGLCACRSRRRGTVFEI
eukprot:m.606338 g.606338  ORF g.606338 m.606338 type:complete len:105 (-) comp58112_c1_seq23:299-613(-)